jgi:rhodanese-related sulfurtransferase
MDPSTSSGHRLPTAAVDGVPDPLPEHLVVLDVREDDEWQAGRIEGSVHIPLMHLASRFAEVPTTGQTLVVCRVGSRSAQAAAYLLQHGVDAVNLAGGLVAWARAGRPLVADGGRPPLVL